MKKLFKNQYGLVRSGWIILICMFLYYALQYVLSGLLVGVLRKILVMTGDINYAANYYSPLADTFDYQILPVALQFLLELVTIAIPVAAWKLMKYRWRDIGLRDFSKRFKKDGVIGLLVGIAGTTLIFLILLITKNVRVDSAKPTFSLSIFVWIIVFVFIGFAEEFFNRGLLMSVLRRTNNKFLIIVLPSVIFGCIHLWNPNVTFISILNIIMIGIVLSFMYYKSGNLWMCIGYHTTWNLFESIVYGMPVSGMNVPTIVASNYPVNNILNGGGFGIEGGILTTIFSILLFLFVFYYYRNSDFQFLPDPHVSKNEKELNTKGY